MSSARWRRDCSSSTSRASSSARRFRDHLPQRILPVLKLKHIAERLECRLEGDGEIEIARLAGLEDAGAGDLTFFANPKYAAALRGTKASAVILGERADAAPCAMLRAPNPYFAF